jgi:hypothetical protein
MAWCRMLDRCLTAALRAGRSCFSAGNLFARGAWPCDPPPCAAPPALYKARLCRYAARPLVWELPAGESAAISHEPANACNRATGFARGRPGAPPNAQSNPCQVQPCSASARRHRSACRAALRRLAACVTARVLAACSAFRNLVTRLLYSSRPTAPSQQALYWHSRLRNLG